MADTPIGIGDASRRLRLLVVGSRGSGKSSLGNALLGADVFEVADGGQSVEECRVGSSGLVSVVESPYPADDAASVQELRQQLQDAFYLSPDVEEFDAILLTIKLDRKFTRLQRDCVDKLARAFGSRRFFSCATLVFTHADCIGNSSEEFQRLLRRMRQEFPSFEQWLRMCNDRCVMLDSTSQDLRQRQVQQLLQTLPSHQQQPYGVADWNAAGRWLLPARLLPAAAAVVRICMAVAALLLLWQLWGAVAPAFYSFIARSAEPTPSPPPPSPPPPSPPPLPPPSRRQCTNNCSVLLPSASSFSFSVWRSSLPNFLVPDCSFGELLRAGVSFVNFFSSNLHFSRVSDSTLEFTNVHASRISF